MVTSTRFRVFVLAVTLPVVLCAQDPNASQAELIRTLLTRIDQLEKRVAELEGKAGAPAAPLTPAPAPPVEPEPVVHDHGSMPSSSVFPAMRWTGFTDLNFSATDQRGSRSGFNEGQFILHVSSALSSRVSYFGELSIVARTDAGLGAPPAPGFNVEVERSIIRYDQSDKLKLSFGRYHTPINYFNTAYHHGSWLHTTIARPEMTQFGGSFIPVHFVGALAEGALPAGGLNLNYNAGVGNGRSTAINRSGDFGDVNNNRAWLFNLFVKPDRLYGLQVGGSVYRDKITSAAGEFREWIHSAHLVWNRESLEFLSEVANVHHEAVGPLKTASNSIAYYLQTAYKLPGLEKSWKPYYRFEYIHIPRSDTLFRLVPSANTSIIGLRYDFSAFAALKFEYRNIGRPGQPRVNGAFAQTSFVF
jgi:hypothetical protein